MISGFFVNFTLTLLCHCVLVSFQSDESLTWQEDEISNRSSDAPSAYSTENEAEVPNGNFIVSSDSYFWYQWISSWCKFTSWPPIVMVIIPRTAEHRSKGKDNSAKSVSHGNTWSCDICPMQEMLGWRFIHMEHFTKWGLLSQFTWMITWNLPDSEF